MLRAELGISQSELARRLKIKQPTLSVLESGRTQEVQASTLDALVRELQTTSAYLLHGKGPAHPSKESAQLSQAAQVFARYYESLPADQQRQLREIARTITGKAIPDHEVEEKMPVTKPLKKQ